MKNSTKNILSAEIENNFPEMTTESPGVEELVAARMWNQGGLKTILIVDDEKAVLNLTDRMLSSDGYKTIAVDSAREAVNIYKQNSPNIDLVILDMVMPDMDGHEVYKEIMSLTPDAKILLTSGFSMSGQVAPEVAENIQGFVQKPFSMSDLLSTVRNAMYGNRKMIAAE